jgi:hypothetical protein
MHPDYEKRLTEAAESTATQIARVADMLQDTKIEIRNIGKELGEGGETFIKYLTEIASRYGL